MTSWFLSILHFLGEKWLRIFQLRLLSTPPSGRQLQVTLGRENEKLDLFSIAMEFNLAYEKDSFRIPFSIITFD